MEYWSTFVDDNTRLYGVATMKAKSMTFPEFKQFKASADNRTHRRIGILRDDEGGEYMSNSMRDLNSNTQCATGLSRMEWQTESIAPLRRV